MSKGKGKRRRLRNQQIAKQQNRSLQNYVDRGTFALHDGSSDLSKASKVSRNGSRAETTRSEEEAAAAELAVSVLSPKH